jgi:hypothetical protein
LHFLPCIIRAIKSGIMRLAGHVAHMGEIGTKCRILVGKLELRVGFWWGNWNYVQGFGGET